MKYDISNNNMNTYKSLKEKYDSIKPASFLYAVFHRNFFTGLTVAVGIFSVAFSPLAFFIFLHGGFPPGHMMGIILCPIVLIGVPYLLYSGGRKEFEDEFKRNYGIDWPEYEAMCKARLKILKAEEKKRSKLKYYELYKTIESPLQKYAASVTQEEPVSVESNLLMNSLKNKLIKKDGE